MFDRIKDIIFKIKDYDRLAHDYSCCLCYFTNNRLSKTTYEISGLETIICDTIGEYMDEGYDHGKKDTIELVCAWLVDRDLSYLCDELREAMEE